MNFGGGEGTILKISGRPFQHFNFYHVLNLPYLDPFYVSAIQGNIFDCPFLIQ